VFESRIPTRREVDKLSADVETVCYDWRRMRWVLERLAAMPWWDLHTLQCIYCRAPFEVSQGYCHHEADCVYERCCQIVGVPPLSLPNEAVLAEWDRESQSSQSVPF